MGEAGMSEVRHNVDVDVFISICGLEMGEEASTGAYAEVSYGWSCSCGMRASVERRSNVHDKALAAAAVHAYVMKRIERDLIWDVDRS